MEKTKDIPRWHQRLINEHAKPASEVTFKQYCHYHETRTKVLYPFLPAEQIKGKLFTQWKRQQPQNQNTSLKEGMKKIPKSRKFPVVVFGKDTSQKTTLEKSFETQFDWLKENIAPKAAVMREKTYKNRAFTLVPKVPVIISETPNPERSILKNTSTPREKRQPASQVSFTLNDPECHSPQLYSPPTPFVLSPMSDDGQNPDILPSKYNHPSSNFGQLPDIISIDNSPVKQRVKTVFEKPTGREMVTDQYPLKKTANQFQKTLQSVENQKNVSNRKPQGRRAKKEIQFTSVTSKDVNLTECSHLSSQYLEPPKFGPVQQDSEEEQDKRFCLFEDEWIKPRTPPKKSKGRKTKSKPLTEEREELFSWSQSPALGCSQYTPKVNKSKKGLFPTEQEIYHRQKQAWTSSKQTEHPQDDQQKRQARSGKKVLSQTSANTASLKRTQNNKRKAKNVPGERNAKQTLKTHKAQSEDNYISGLQPEEDYMLRKKENIGRVNQPQAKTFKSKETRQLKQTLKTHKAQSEDTCISDLLPEEEYVLREKENIGRVNQPQAKTFKSKETRQPKQTLKTHKAQSEDTYISDLQPEEDYMLREKENIRQVNQPQAKTFKGKETWQLKQTLKTHKAQSEDNCISDLLPEEEYTLREKENIGRVNRPQAKTLKSKETRQHSSGVKEDQQTFGRGKPMGSTISPQPWTSESAFQSGHQSGSGHSKNRARLTKGRDESYEETENASDANSPVPQEKQYMKEIQTCDNREKDDDFFAPSPNLVSPISSKAASPAHQTAAQHNPQQAQGSDLLRRILFQLKSTASSGENVDPSSPAQSRMTEASGMSVRTLSSNGPSPDSSRDVGDFMDDLESSRDLSFKKTPTIMRSGGSAYRKRGNILCNMFDASDSDISVTAKKRFLPSEARLSESDLNILFSADIFV